MTDDQCSPSTAAGSVAPVSVKLLGAMLVWLVALAGPASAHGSTPDASNYASRVTGVVETVDGEPAEALSRRSEVQWRVLGTDALLEVTNTGPGEVIVEGYDGESYLRVGPDGVFENRRSPAAYMNADRFMRTMAPPYADPAAEPEWRRISAEPRWRWHDHRIHWMAPGLPPQGRG